MADPGSVEADAPKPYWSHWWESVNSENFRQGDLVRSLTVFWLPSDLPPPDEEDTEPPEVLLKRHRGDWIIGTASCDLDARGFPQMVLLPVYSADAEGFDSQNKKEFRYTYEAVRRDLHPRRFMLAEHPEVDPAFPISFAEFANLAMVPTEYVRGSVEGQDRLRLRHPLREKFGNWIGGRFSAVGPENETRLPAEGHMHDKRLIEVVEEVPQPADDAGAEHVEVQGEPGEDPEINEE